MRVIRRILIKRIGSVGYRLRQNLETEPNVHRLFCFSAQIITFVSVPITSTQSTRKRLFRSNERHVMAAGQSGETCHWKFIFPSVNGVHLDGIHRRVVCYDSSFLSNWNDFRSSRLFFTWTDILAIHFRRFRSDEKSVSVIRSDRADFPPLPITENNSSGKPLKHV